AILGFGASAQANANPNPTVFPGMQIYQGDTACMVGFVEPRLRVALTTGQCDRGSLVTDRDKNLVGTVTVARHQGAGDAQAVEYEVIGLAPNVGATDLLPTGRRLHSTPAVRAQQGLTVCQLRTSAGQRCGSIWAVSSGRFAIDSNDSGAVDDRD